MDWFYSPLLLNSGQDQISISRLDDSQENVTIREQTLFARLTLRVRSRLEVTKLDASDVGQYWCGIRTDSTEWMVLSDPVALQPPSEYMGLDPCSTSVAQSKRERKCATWTFDPTSNTPPPSPVPPTPPTPPLTTESFTEIESEEVTKREEVTTVDIDTAPLPEEGSENDQDQGPLMEFYIAVGILAAFGTVITALVLLVICMCIKYKRMIKGN